MEPKVNYTIVGAFVISLIAAIVVIIIWLSGFSAENYKIYKVDMREPVSGLNVDAAVEFNGVAVGTVSSIKINKKNPQLVELLLKVNDEVPITNGTRAKLDLRSLSGATYMQLEDKGTDMRPLKILPGQKYPIIASTPSILVRFSTMLNQISNSFKQVSQSIQQLLDKENLLAIKHSLINLRKFTGTLSNSSDEIEAILNNMAKVSHSFQYETIPAASRAFTKFGDATENINELSGQLKQNPAVIIRGRASLPLGPGE